MADDLNINIGANPAGVEQGSRRAKVALKGVADGGRDLDAALRRLRTAIDPTYAALEKYNKVHQDNLALMRAGIISRKEYNAGMKAAKAALEQETAALERNTAAGRAKIEAERQARQQQLQAAKAAKDEEVRLAREANQARRQAEKEAAAAAKAAKAEERAANKAAAEEAKRLARETAEAERVAKRQASEAAKAAKAEERAAVRAQREEESRLRRQSVEEERAARRQQREASKAATAAAAAEARAQREAARTAARAQREAAAAAEALARAEADAARAAQQLRASIDPAFAAQQRFNETMRRANELLRQGRISQQELIAIQRQATAQRDIDVRSMGAQNAMYVQLGYQAQDVTASLASGIDPIVILAQQAGQTAAAMSGMGGVMGRVAAFVAGPWGAAIIGATLLLAYLWDANKDLEKSTKDVMNAEDRRKMSLGELTEALREYRDAQEKANDSTIASAEAQAQATRQSELDLVTKIGLAQDRLNKAQERYNAAISAPLGSRERGDIGLAKVELEAAKAAIDKLKIAYKEVEGVAAEAAAARLKSLVEAGELGAREQREQDAALAKFRADFKAAGTDIKAQTVAEVVYGKRLVEIREKYAKLRKEEARDGDKSAKALEREASAAAKLATYQDPLKGAGQWSNNFGQDRGTYKHQGVDISAKAGTPIYAAQAGVVKVAQWSDTLGYYVVLDHGGGIKTRYGHMQSMPTVGVGDQVGMDTMIGRVGNTGRSKGNHLHYEVRQGTNDMGGGGTPLRPQAGGQYSIDAIQAEQASIIALDKARKEALENYVAEIDYRQELAGEDLRAVISLQDEKIRAIEEFYGEDSKQASNAAREKVRMEQRLQAQILQAQQEGMRHQLDLTQRHLDSQRDLQSAEADRATEVVSFNEQEGLIDPREALTQRAAILDEEYAQEVAHQEALMQLRRAYLEEQLSLPGLAADQAERLHRELEAAEAQHLQNRAAMQAQYAREVQQVQMEAAARTNAQWRDLAQTMTSSMSQAFQGIWTHSTTFFDIMVNMADQLVYKFADMGLKMMEDWFMRQVGMTVTQQAQEGIRTTSTAAAQAAQTGAVIAGVTTQTGARAGAATTEAAIRAATTTAAVTAEAVKTGAAVTGAATQQSVGAAAGMAEIGTRAATSAAGAFSSTVVIPFIGPVAAPVAAAAALAAVLGFGALISARGGQGEVPMDGQLSMLHKKEMVLPERFAVPLRQMLVGGPRSSSGLMSAASAAGSSARESMGSSNSANFYYQPNNTNMSADFGELLRSDAQSLRRWIRNEVRNGGLKFQ